MEKNNITIILPVYGLDEIRKPLFNNAIKSVADQNVLPDELLLVVPKNDLISLNYVKEFDFGSLKDCITIIENDGDTDFASQFNLGVEKAKSEWVSLIEQDDEISKTLIANVIKYRNAHTEIDMFLPLIVDVDSNGSFIGLTNEACWANSFSDVLGILDNSALLAYQNFNIDGMCVKKSILKDFGGFKKNIKLTFIYEFLLRMTFKDVKIMVIPKLGYKHVNQLSGSLFHEYRQTMDPIEAKWWLAQAKQEYYFQKDREITYNTQV